MKKPDVTDIVRRQSLANFENPFLVPSTKKPAKDHGLVFPSSKKGSAFLPLSLKGFVVTTATFLVSTGVVYAALTFTGTGITSDGNLTVGGTNITVNGTTTLNGRFNSSLHTLPTSSNASPAYGDFWNSSGTLTFFNGTASQTIPFLAGALSGTAAAPTLRDFVSVNDYSGADLSVKANACLAALPPTGGTCDGRGLTGIQTISTAINVPANAMLILPNTKINNSVNAGDAITMGSHSRIVGGGRATVITDTANGGSAIIGVTGSLSSTTTAPTGNLNAGDLSAAVTGATGANFPAGSWVKITDSSITMSTGRCNAYSCNSEYVKIKAQVGDTLYFSQGLAKSYLSASTTFTLVNAIVDVGVSDLTIDINNFSQTYGVAFHYAFDSFESNVEIRGWTQIAHAVLESNNIQIENASAFDSPADLSGGSGVGYGVAVFDSAGYVTINNFQARNLRENPIGSGAHHVSIIGGSVSGVYQGCYNGHGAYTSDVTITGVSCSGSVIKSPSLTTGSAFVYGIGWQDNDIRYTISDNVISNIPGPCIIAGSGSSSTPARVGTIANNTLFNCDGGNTRGSIYLLHSQDMEVANNTIHRNRTNDSGSAGIFLNGDDQRINVHDNHVIFDAAINNAIGFELSGGSGVVSSNNQFNHNTAYFNGGSGTIAFDFVALSSGDINGLTLDNNVSVGAATNLFVSNPNAQNVNFVGSQILENWCTGAVSSNATDVLWPSSTATTCATTAASERPVPRAGTVTALYVRGVAVSSGTDPVTLYRNGSATAVTCNLVSGTSCNDTTHQVQFAQGDTLSVRVVTGVGDTLTTVRAEITFQ